MTMQKITSFLIILTFLLSFNVVKAQDYPYDVPQYDFVRYDLNKFIFYKDSTTFQGLYNKYDKLIMKGQGNINVVHIGGSHIQAGVLSGHTAGRLQTFYPGLKGSRGFVFPYRIARTNNPWNYYAHPTGIWTSCRSVERKKNCILGLSGISATTHDITATLDIVLRDEIRHIKFTEYEFNQIKILHDTDSSSFDIVVENSVYQKTYPEQGYTIVKLKDYTDVLKMSFKADTTQDHFTLYGILLEAAEPGISYHGIGVNGASIPCYLRSQLLKEHLAVINPDWVILTLGTNDAYTRNFNPDIYQANYDSLLTYIREVAPNAAILMTVPNDSYLYRRYMNPNTAVTGEVIRKLAQKHNCGVWDFYNIMGGLNSITLWYKEGMSSRDKIHFTRKGYELQADLLFNAFLRSYEFYLEKNKTEISENN